MKVLIYHPVLMPPKDYGGVERVVLWLARGLRERGHDVWVGAAPGSRMPEGIHCIEVDQGNMGHEEILRLLPRGLEMVHFMAPVDPAFVGKLPCPTLLTIQGNGKPGETFPKNTVFLSRNHAQRHRATEFVFNGIDPREFRFEARKENWFLFLSKTSWNVKNVRGAMRACSAAGVPLKIAGGARPWTARAEAWLRPSMQWVGAVAGERKADLLARSCGFLFPVTWPEPFGIVIAEALISGTPVIGSRRGSIPELVPPDVGAIFDREEDLPALLLSISGKQPWDPARCREWAETHFSYRVMAERYEGCYRRILGGETLQSREPVAGDWRTQL